MAVTGAIFNRLIYGGIDSADYGIYITGEAVYNAPERAVDLVAVPGRNGDVVIDQGRWENIEIEYPAGCFADDQTAFATAISDFRNAICSQLGYQRLTDTYHPDEYRLAIYTSGIEVEPVRRDNGFGGEFTIKFNAKPQRWLTSGEDPVSVTSGDEITNPTPFASSPLLMIDGYGNISFNGQNITIANEIMGDITLPVLPAYYENPVSAPVYSYPYEIDRSLFNVGDTINVYGIDATINASINRAGTVTSFRSSQYSNLAVSPPGYSNYSIYSGGTYTGDSSATIGYHLSDLNFVIGTPKTYSISADFTMPFNPTPLTESIGNFELVFAYDGDATITSTITVLTGSTHCNIDRLKYNETGIKKDVTGHSTKSILGNPIYIDCDLGEAYKIENDLYISLNQYIDLGSDLPTLGSGANEITYDNTVTNLDVVPRWWKL